ncbi:MAG: acetolactate synthase small subunit [Endomicrobia bacterium]|nr:acetolactate synthase small subunit [Endomicrobiia bacterium]
MRHTISVLVENKFGVLARISTLFAARGFNIDSLAVGETEDPAISRMTIVVKGDDSILEQITKQLNKLVDVIKVNDFSGLEYVERGLALEKINAPKTVRAEIFRIAGVFRTRIIDIAKDSVIVEVTGDEEKIEAFIEAIADYGIKEVCRTGVIAMSRGHK